MAKKKAAESVPEATAPAMHAAPGVTPGYGMPQPQMGMPGMMPGMMPQMAPAGGNPMMAMMQMMQMMMGGGVAPQMIDPAAAPFGAGAAVDDGNKGLDSEIIRPALLDNLIKEQHAVATGSVLDVLCLTNDRQNALGGIPQRLHDSPWRGLPEKERPAPRWPGCAAWLRRARRSPSSWLRRGFTTVPIPGGMTCARGWSRSAWQPRACRKLSSFRRRSRTSTCWKASTTRGRPGRFRHEVPLPDRKGEDRVRRDRLAQHARPQPQPDGRQPVGSQDLQPPAGGDLPVHRADSRHRRSGRGESLKHTADAVFLIEEFSLGSKEIAEQWGGAYRDRIDVIRVVKSVTTPIFPHMIRIDREPSPGDDRPSVATHCLQNACAEIDQLAVIVSGRLFLNRTSR